SCCWRSTGRRVCCRRAAPSARSGWRRRPRRWRSARSRRTPSSPRAVRRPTTQHRPMRGAAVAETVQQPTPVTTGDTLLSLDDVTLKFGGVTALNGVSFHIDRGEILGLIGPNGAGKTTAFNVVTGIYRPTSGGVTFDGEQITEIGRASCRGRVELTAGGGWR